MNESYSDIFAVSTGFFHEGAGAAGTYEYGSEYAAGTLRSLSDPWSVRLQTGVYQLRYEFALGVNPTDDRFVFYSGALFQNAELLAWVPEWCCYGAEHWNSTILSHAFYLAIEGGTNLATQITVEGAGAANREQVERIFFRALTELMPQRVRLWVAADVIRQAAADLERFRVCAVGPAGAAIGRRVPFHPRASGAGCGWRRPASIRPGPRCSRALPPVACGMIPRGMSLEEGGSRMKRPRADPRHG